MRKSELGGSRWEPFGGEQGHYQGYIVLNRWVRCNMNTAPTNSLMINPFIHMYTPYLHIFTSYVKHFCWFRHTKSLVPRPPWSLPWPFSTPSSLRRARQTQRKSRGSTVGTGCNTELDLASTVPVWIWWVIQRW